MLFLPKILALETTSESSLHSLVDWAREYPFAITVCDKNGKIIYMNQKSLATFTDQGGENLIGKSLYDCHSPRSCDIIRELLQTGRNNLYTIEKKGVKKLISQTPWFNNGEIAGLVEISLVLPEDMPHFIRQ